MKTLYLNDLVLQTTVTDSFDFTLTPENDQTLYDTMSVPVKMNISSNIPQGKYILQIPNFLNTDSGWIECTKTTNSGINDRIVISGYETSQVQSYFKSNTIAIYKGNTLDTITIDIDSGGNGYFYIRTLNSLPYYDVFLYSSIYLDNPYYMTSPDFSKPPYISNGITFTKNYDQIIEDGISILKLMNYYEEGQNYVKYSSSPAYNSSTRLPPRNFSLQDHDPEDFAQYNNYQPSYFLSGLSGYDYKNVPENGGGTLDASNCGLNYSADNIRYLWRLSNYIRANNDDIVLNIAINHSKGMLYSYEPKPYCMELNTPIFQVNNVGNVYSADMITPVLAGIHSTLTKKNTDYFKDFINIVKDTNNGGLAPPSFDYAGYFNTTMSDNQYRKDVYPLLDSISSGGQQLGITMTAFFCTAEVLLNSYYNTMKLYDGVESYTFQRTLPYPSGYTNEQIKNIIDIYYALAFTGHNFGLNLTNINSECYMLNVHIDDINVDKSGNKLFDIYTIPDSGWGGNMTVEIFSYQLLTAALSKRYDIFCALHRMYYYMLFVQNGGQMNQSIRLWSNDLDINNINKRYFYDSNGNQVQFPGGQSSSETPIPKSQNSYVGNTSVFNGNWQPSYYLDSFKGAVGWNGLYNGNPIYDLNKIEQGGWSKRTDKKRNRYTCSFSYPSYLLGYHIYWDTPTTIRQNTQPINVQTILQNGPINFIKNPYFTFKGGDELRSATDGEFNIYMAYYIASKLAETGEWLNYDNGITNDTSLSAYACGRKQPNGSDVTWSFMRKEIAKSINSNNGGASNILYQNSSNCLLFNRVNSGKYLVNLGHDTDATAVNSIHLDYTDLRLYQLLKEEFSNSPTPPSPITTLVLSTTPSTTLTDISTSEPITVTNIVSDYQNLYLCDYNKEENSNVLKSIENFGTGTTYTVNYNDVKDSIPSSSTVLYFVTAGYGLKSSPFTWTNPLIVTLVLSTTPSTTVTNINTTNSITVTNIVSDYQNLYLCDYNKEENSNVLKSIENFGSGTTYTVNYNDVKNTIPSSSTVLYFVTAGYGLKSSPFMWTTN
jgi:hypothetical protein